MPAEFASRASDLSLADERKDRLAKLLKRYAEGVFVAPYERGEIGPGLFEPACRMGLEGLVSKHRERRYLPRTCDWRKVSTPRSGV